MKAPGLIIQIIILAGLASCSGTGTNKKHSRVGEDTVTRAQHLPQQQMSMKPGEWMQRLDALDTSDECLRDIVRQVRYLQAETLAEHFTFDKYLVRDTLKRPSADLDISRSKTARAFRTKIRQELQEQGVNFAGKYSLVGVGMTGWGENRWIVDRTNGKAYNFPYLAESIQFRKDSRLIIVEPRDIILSKLKSTTEPHENCYFIYGKLRQMDLRPFYFEWKNDRLVLLGPKDIPPPVNDFWRDYFQ
jgi:hypothetical protein